MGTDPSKSILVGKPYDDFHEDFGSKWKKCEWIAAVMYLLMKRFYALLLLLTSLGSMGCCCAFIIYAIRGIAFCHVRPSTIRTVPDYYFFHFAKTLNGFRRNSRELIITTNRFFLITLGETGTGREQNSGRSRVQEKIRIDVNQFRGDVASTDWSENFRYITDEMVHLKSKIWK